VLPIEDLRAAAGIHRRRCQALAPCGRAVAGKPLPSGRTGPRAAG
jgi:hypothetical protein